MLAYPSATYDMEDSSWSLARFNLVFNLLHLIKQRRDLPASPTSIATNKDLSTYSPDVEFCGYSIPHPSEAKMNVRIQTYGEFFSFLSFLQLVTSIPSASAFDILTHIVDQCDVRGKERGVESLRLISGIVRKRLIRACRGYDGL